MIKDMLDENDLEKEIKNLERNIKNGEMNKTMLTMLMIITTLTILAGGLLLGTLFGHMGLCITTALFACIPTEATMFTKRAEIVDKIKYAYQKIAECKRQKDHLRALRMEAGEVVTNTESMNASRDFETKFGGKTVSTEKKNEKKETVVKRNTASHVKPTARKGTTKKTKTAYSYQPGQKKPIERDEAYLKTLHEFYDDSEFLDQLEGNEHKKR